MSVACWEDGLYSAGGVLMSRSRLATDDVYGYVWNNVWQWGQAGRAHQLANNRFKVRESAFLPRDAAHVALTELICMH